MHSLVFFSDLPSFMTWFSSPTSPVETEIANKASPDNTRIVTAENKNMTSNLVIMP